MLLLVIERKPSRHPNENPVKWDAITDCRATLLSPTLARPLSFGNCAEWTHLHSSGVMLAQRTSFRILVDKRNLPKLLSVQLANPLLQGGSCSWPGSHHFSAQGLSYSTCLH